MSFLEARFLRSYSSGGLYDLRLAETSSRRHTRQQKQDGVKGAQFVREGRADFGRAAFSSCPELAHGARIDNTDDSEAVPDTPVETV